MHANPTSARRRRRRWRVVSWSCAALALLVLTACPLSHWWHVERNGRPYYFAAELSDSRLLFMWFVWEPDGSRSGFGNVGWNLRRQPQLGPPAWRPRVDLRPAGGASLAYVSLPLWPLVVALAGSAMWAGRRARRTVCDQECTRCGYARAGLRPDDPCPECGASP